MPPCRWLHRLTQTSRNRDITLLIIYLVCLISGVFYMSDQNGHVMEALVLENTLQNPTQKLCMSGQSMLRGAGPTRFQNEERCITIHCKTWKPDPDQVYVIQVPHFGSVWADATEGNNFKVACQMVSLTTFFCPHLTNMHVHSSPLDNHDGAVQGRNDDSYLGAVTGAPDLVGRPVGGWNAQGMYSELSESSRRVLYRLMAYSPERR
jgi:hypothetical protein